MASFLKKTTLNVNKPEEKKDTPTLNKTIGIKPKNGLGIKKTSLIKKVVNEESENTKEVQDDDISIVKIQKIDVDENQTDIVEDSTKEIEVEVEIKEEVKEIEQVKEEVETKEEVVEEVKEEEKPQPQKEELEEELEEEVEETKKVAKKTKRTQKKTTKASTKQAISLEEAEEVMSEIIAPTTSYWEKEKEEVLNILKSIKVEKNMTKSQITQCIAELDEFNFEILQKTHDSETNYNGAKQNYESIKSMALANASASNSEGRKAEALLACRSFTTPDGRVVDLQQYMLLIEERYRFYQKITEGINFKRYSLINYNSILKTDTDL